MNDANMTEQHSRSVTSTIELPLQSETSNESNETSTYFTYALQNDQNHIENNNTNNYPSKNILGSINIKSTENI